MASSVWDRFTTDELERLTELLDRLCPEPHEDNYDMDRVNRAIGRRSVYHAVVSELGRREEDDDEHGIGTGSSAASEGSSA